MLDNSTRILIFHLAEKLFLEGLCIKSNIKISGLSICKMRAFAVFPILSCKFFFYRKLILQKNTFYFDKFKKNWFLFTS